MTVVGSNRVCPSFILVMGVSGSGKTSVAHRLVARLDGVFIEADDFHPQSNIALMSAGKALDDDHRWPWLKAVAEAALKAAADHPGYVVIACSALKRIYRDRLRKMIGPMLIVHLNGPKQLIQERLSSRRAHFMPPTLLESQFATLEPLEDDEQGFEVSIDQPVEQIVESICAHLVDAGTV